MRKAVFTLILLLFATLSVTNAQTTSENLENERIVTHVSGDNYDVIYKDANGNIFQEGQYLKVGDRLKAHGVWKLYDRNTQALVTTAEYNKGEQLWVETNINGQIVRIDQTDLKVKRLEERILALEKKISDSL